MIARAPGKLVLSGAYSVLEGAPAVVAAVDRYAVADSERPPERVPEEVQAAVRSGALSEPCFLDASALRTRDADGSDRKLGLGSSAALLVATLAARWSADAGPSALPLELDRDRLFDVALSAHREAQGGGSGVDVAASVFGRVLACRCRGDALEVHPVELPPVVITVFVADRAAVTADLLQKVNALRASRPVEHARWLNRAAEHACRAAAATTATAFVEALEGQFEALGGLGRAAGAPIVTPEVSALCALAARHGAAFGPSGAGGGDVALYVGLEAPDAEFVEAARERALSTLPLDLGARGVHLVSSRDFAAS